MAPEIMDQTNYQRPSKHPVSQWTIRHIKLAQRMASQTYAQYRQPYQAPAPGKTTRQYTLIQRAFRTFVQVK